MNRAIYDRQVNRCAAWLRRHLKLAPEEHIETAFVLGTGWGDAFAFEPDAQVAMKELHGPFVHLEDLDGHARRYEIGTVTGRRIIVQRGRVHMNEFVFNPEGKLAVRAQIEVLLRLGVKNFVLTTGVGSLSTDIAPGDVVFIDGWLSAWSEEMPLFPGEFTNPEDVLQTQMIDAITQAAPEGLRVVHGSHVFWQGPHFEGRRYDKSSMRHAGGDCVSMSVKPEAAVASLYADQGVKIIALGFVCNTQEEAMEHEHHRNVAREAAPKLARLLQAIIPLLHPEA